MDRWLAVLGSIQHMPKRYLGIVFGIMGWILIEIFGFFPTLLLAVLMVIGYALGRIFEGRANWQDVVERIWQSDPYDH